MALAEIEKLLNKAAKSLLNFDGMPIPDKEYMQDSMNSLIFDELSYDHDYLESETIQLVNQLNHNQRDIYNSVMEELLTI